ncbi:LacI family DNA-binding transcriptional regulator [Streptomyces stelliscabiei]|uniref:DNA-binding LacI/PurR family transcriptional regulator n=1 Tax=Streptomyces stelliscabiei TaxID=146820 RepID=A0A8I0P9S5_9ACTN|nr:LacI family DNA-binding transcriptional regulator [Streptomyces stelliscabiei]KND41889.1 LacI family transcriptional regulator [Streptomyces stelliscabiei]MBE1598739.1 DNA-binding LacI/PurR family transcriptional regulator [Streptomyces stelliscabiei]MDX2516472.1 LacI family DNA-binding transcriptional regulator [Streptomyces stelliscabiei]MDX2553645.1 LacI family DNA-binding transcriptional regulator [Streptomyces stelliscabiei]MDX2613379.1 LacI family DNA-binding transcriptional regulator
MGDVARLAGVSSQTVSRVSNGFAGVNEDTRRQVLTAMRELGYRPNSAARALRRGEFRTLGVITFSLSTLGNIRTLDAIATSAAREGYAVTLLPVAVPTQDEVNGAFSRLGELAVDAVIVIMEVHLLDAATVSVPPGVQVVVADSDAGDRYTVVDTDQAGGARDAVRHLLELGHGTVWHLAGPEDSFAAQRRANAWRATLDEAGRPAPPLVRGDWSAESGYRAGLRIAEQADCTAVFVANDQMALGLLRALNERGRRVPEDVSVVGFDDIPEAASFLPPLTTVHQDFAEVGRLCVAGVLSKMREGGVESQGRRDGQESGEHGTTLVPTRLVRRRSTASPPTPVR